MQFDIEDFHALRDYLSARECLKAGDAVSFENLRQAGDHHPALIAGYIDLGLSPQRWESGFKAKTP